MGNEYVEKHLGGRERAPIGIEVGQEHAVLEVTKGSPTAFIVMYDGSIPEPPVESELMRVILDTADFHNLTLAARVPIDDLALVGFYLRSGFKQVGYYSDVPETSDSSIKANEGDIKYVMGRKPALDYS